MKVVSRKKCLRKANFWRRMHRLWHRPCLYYKPLVLEAPTPVVLRLYYLNWRMRWYVLKNDVLSVFPYFLRWILYNQPFTCYGLRCYGFHIWPKWWRRRTIDVCEWLEWDKARFWGEKAEELEDA